MPREDAMAPDELLIRDMETAFAQDLQMLLDAYFKDGRPPFTHKLTQDEQTQRMLAMTDEEWAMQLEQILLLPDGKDKNKAKADWFENKMRAALMRFSMQTGVAVNPADVVA